jgi:hypothetical protein
MIWCRSVPAKRGHLSTYVVSMDHCPNETVEAGDRWHTSVLLISVAADQWALGTDLGGRLNSQTGKLQKWAGSKSCRERYRKNFRRIFPDALSKSPIVAVAFSAQVRHGSGSDRPNFEISVASEPKQGALYWEIYELRSAQS